MTTSDIDFRFPLIGFTADGDLWGFPDREALTICGPRTLKERKPVGMELVDSEGRRWVVRSLTRAGRAGALLPWLASSLLSGTPQSRIEYELEALSPVSLEEVKARVQAGIEAHPDNWVAWQDREAELPEIIAGVMTAASIPALYDGLGLDWFAAY